MESSKPVVYLIASDADLRAGMAKQLAAAGFQTRQFASDTAFRAAVDQLPAGCILFEIDIPGRLGICSIARIRTAGIAMPLIAQAEDADVPLAVSAMKAGATDFLARPCSQAALARRIEEACARHAAVPSPSASNGARRRLDMLTSREHEVLGGLIQGLTNKKIAASLGISPRTVEVHRARLMRRLEAKSVSDIVIIAIAAGFPVPGPGSR